MGDLGDKLDEYVKRITDAEDKEDWQKVIDICKEYSNVIDILMDSTDNIMDQKHYFIIRSTVAVLRRVSTQALKQDKINKDVDRRLNDAYVKINKLEKTREFDSPEKMR